VSVAKVLGALEQELIDAGIVRWAGQAGSGARPWLPPVWIMPQEGPIAPGDRTEGNARDDGVVVSLVHSGGIPNRPYELMMRKTTVDIWIRAHKAPAVYALENQIRERIGEQRNYMLGNGDPARRIKIIECVLWRDIQPIGVESEGQGGAWVVSYLIESYQAVPARDW
jgi:hypothetical protein